MLRVFASRQIRSRATLGGNLATASPIGDSAPALMTFDAALVTRLGGGRARDAAGEDPFTGYPPDGAADKVRSSRRSPCCRANIWPPA